MVDLQSVPQSVRLKLEEAQSLLSNEQVEDAQKIFLSVAAEVSKTHPGLAALIVGMLLGHTSIVCSDEERTASDKLMPVKFLGLHLWNERDTYQTVKKSTRTWKLS